MKSLAPGGRGALPDSGGMCKPGLGDLQNTRVGLSRGEGEKLYKAFGKESNPQRDEEIAARGHARTGLSREK